MEDMRKWGYFVEIPEGPGGKEPSIEGKIATCERCNQPFQVKRKEEADECIYHWGKPYTKKMNGTSGFRRKSLSYAYHVLPR